MFPALLRYWRRKRGLSQLDLSTVADVSARHISFLETGRAGPSPEMVRRLTPSLGLSVREENRLLEAAGHAPRFVDPDADRIDPEVSRVVEKMAAQLAPWPVVALDRMYDVVHANGPARALFTALGLRGSGALNMCDALFDPTQARPFVEDWERLARRLLARLHHIALIETSDTAHQALITRLTSYPEVPSDWRLPDFGEDTLPIMPLRLALPGGVRLSFLTTITAFSDPRRRAVEELVLETYVPEDAATEAFLGALAAST